MSRLASLAVFLLLLPIVSRAQYIRDTASDGPAACKEIGHARIAWHTYNINPTYYYSRHHYWNAGNGDLEPSCVVLPRNTNEVAEIVRILGNYPEVKSLQAFTVNKTDLFSSFTGPLVQIVADIRKDAIKSGGHNPNINWSSVNKGVLISMSNMHATVLADDNKTATVEPGARWIQVAQTLVPKGYTVVGGRLGDVGVGGLTLGCGLSFLSAQYGLVCDNVVNYEVVQANGTIVNANSTCNIDLWWALKGGGNQFGIVTKFTMNAHPINKTWGGIRSYEGRYGEAIINATHSFTENFHDQKAAVIVTGEIAAGKLLEMFIVFFFYDGESPPDGVFDEFDAIPTFTDDANPKSYSDLVDKDDSVNLYGLRYLIRGTTLPNLPADRGGRELYLEHYRTWKSYVARESLSHPDFIFSMAFQPYPRIVAEVSMSKGGNRLNVLPAGGDRILMEYDVSWLSAYEDEDAYKIAMNITETIDAYVKENYQGLSCSNADKDVDEGSLGGSGRNGLIFLNDAMYDQKPLQSYGSDTYEKMKRIQRTVDPQGFYRRTGGFTFE